MFDKHISVFVHKLAPCIEGKRRPNKEADNSRLGGGSSNKQGNLHVRFVLGSLNTE